MNKYAWEFNRGKWEQIDDPLYRRDTYSEHLAMNESGIEAIGFVTSTRLLDREGLTVEVYSRTGHRKHPYAVRVTMAGVPETVYMTDFQSLLGFLGIVSAAFGG